MSLINDFEIVVHAKNVHPESGFKPCSVNVDSIFIATDISKTDDERPEAISEREKENTRLDLKHLFSTSANIATASHSSQSTYSSSTYRAQSALLVLETTEEIEKLKEEGRAKHIKFLKDSRMSIM